MGKLTVVLASLDWKRPKDPPYSVAHASLATTLKDWFGGSKSLQLYPIQFDVKTSTAWEIACTLLQYQPDWIAWGVYAWNEEPTQQLLRNLPMLGFQGGIILGGPQITFAGAEVQDTYPNVQYFIRGEAEYPLVSLLQALMTNAHPVINQIPGILVQGQQDRGTIHVERSLDRIPSPYLSGIYPVHSNQRFLRWQTARGCPYSCTFCAHKIAKIPVRYFSLPRLFQELDLFTAQQVQEIVVLDPIFNLKRRHYEPLLKYMIDISLTSRLEFQCRLELVQDSFLSLCQNLPEVYLEFGLQTAIPEESKLIKRQNNLKKVKAALQLLNEYSMDYEVHLIFGLPGQTLESFHASIEFLHQQDVKNIRYFPLGLLKGTALYAEKDKWALQANSYFPHEVFSSSTLKPEEWLQMKTYESSNVTRSPFPIKN